MKREYHINTLLAQLDSNINPVKVFKESLLKIPLYNYDQRLFLKISSRIKEEELDSFLNVLENENTEFAQFMVEELQRILLNVKISEEAYNILKRFDLRLNSEVLFDFIDGRNRNTERYDSIMATDVDKQSFIDLESRKSNVNHVNALNFSIFFNRMIKDLNIKEIQTNLSKFFRCLDFIIQDKSTSYEMEEFFQVVKVFAFFLNEQDENIILKAKNSILRYLRTNKSHSATTAMAILDQNGRLNFSETNFTVENRDFYMVRPHQIYNITEDERLILRLCHSEEYLSIYCNRFIHKANKSLIFELNNKEVLINYERIMDNYMLVNNINMLIHFIIHIPQLRHPKYYKFILKSFLNDNQADYSVIELFLENPSFQEIENLSISFLKSISGKSSKKVLKIITFFLKSKKLIFASFTVLLKTFKNGTKLEKLIIRNMIYLNKPIFVSILDLITIYLTGDKQFSMEDLEEVFKDVFQMFSEEKDMLEKYKYQVLPNIKGLNKSEINYRIFVVKSILENSFNSQINDVDVLIEVLFRFSERLTDYIASRKYLDIFFKPNCSYFLKNNLSHILFKIKLYYNINGCSSNRNCILLDNPTHSNTELTVCVFKLLEFILFDLNLNLYFNYIWPYVEYFLSKQTCKCSEGLLEFISRNLNTENFQIISPYLNLEYSNIEDIPFHVESRSYLLLLRFFGLSKDISITSNQIGKYYNDNRTIISSTNQFISSNIKSVEDLSHNRSIIHNTPNQCNTTNIKSDKDSSHINNILHNTLNQCNKTNIKSVEDLSHSKSVLYNAPKQCNINNIKNDRDSSHINSILHNTNQFIPSNIKNDRDLSHSKSIMHNTNQFISSNHHRISNTCNKNFDGQFEKLYIKFTNLFPNINKLTFKYDNQTLYNILLRDYLFIRNFIFNYNSSKIFKTNILKAYKNFNEDFKKLTGVLKHDSLIDNFNFKKIKNLFVYFLENFLIKIDYEAQELYYFTIQEFLKQINIPLKREVEVIVEQFRRTKLNYKFDIDRYKHVNISNTDYKSFLESIFYILYTKNNHPDCMKYLINFDNNVLESAILAMLSNDKNFGQFIIPDNPNNKMINFILKMNSKTRILMDDDFLKLALQTNAYYSIIYVLERKLNRCKITNTPMEQNNIELLQTSYYSINDFEKVKGLFGISNNISLNLLYEFLINKNHSAAKQCFNVFCKHSKNDFIKNTLNEIILENKNEIFDLDKQDGSDEMLLHVIKDLELLMMCYIEADGMTSHNNDKNIINEELSYVSSNPVFNSGELSSNSNTNKFINVNTDINTTNAHENVVDNPIINDKFKNDIKLHNNVENVVDLINERRKISGNPEEILKIHNFISDHLKENEIIFNKFKNYVDFELIKSLRIRKEYLRAENLIAGLILRKEYKAFYELSLIKIEQKHINESKEILNKYIRILSSEEGKERDLNSEKEIFKCYAKLFAISNSTFLFQSKVNDLEEILFNYTGCEESKVGMLDKYKIIYSFIKDLDPTGCNMAIINEVSNKNNVNISIKDINNKQEINFEKLSKNGLNINVRSNKNEPNNMNCKRTNNSLLLENFKHLQKVYFLTAKHFEKSDILISLRFYLKSFNSNYEAIPRFFHNLSSVPRIHSKSANELTDFIISNHIYDLIPYFNQISTKILDGHTKGIISAMLESCPFQTFWNSLILFNSKKLEIKQKMEEIIETLSFDNRIIFKNIVKFSEKLTDISRCANKNLSMADFPDIIEFLSEISKSKLRINIPGHIVYINSLKSEIHVFQSLQMPKKILIQGEDGIIYPMIVKSKDDLRKDSRFMDLKTLLNKIFEDGYYIRGYKIIPFTHDSGIMQFLPDLVNLKEIALRSIKNINESLYRFAKHKKIGGNNMKVLCDMYKPVFLEWMTGNFIDPPTSSMYAEKNT